ncbi:hypothetical protein L3X38_027222 [Prunus dulcis]|uniref:Uncharacterized protein n=1 Tax=Prunus dulcis TaxID=3755 RepID=A0AAD4VPT0_PRUDU|nr:hypothetical protein L3X38_027222 [Prunus dulcis]
MAISGRFRPRQRRRQLGECSPSCAGSFGTGLGDQLQARWPVRRREGEKLSPDLIKTPKPILYMDLPNGKARANTKWSPQNFKFASLLHKPNLITRLGP